MSLKKKPVLGIGGSRYVIVGWDERAPAAPEGGRVVEITSPHELESILRRERQNLDHVRESYGKLSARFRVYRYDEPPRDIHSASVAETEVPDEKKLSWIAFQIMDDDTPAQPVKNTRVVVKDAKGVTHRARTDSKGYIRLDGIEPGSCEVTFPDHDDSDKEDAEASKGKLVLRLPVNPADQSSRDDKFTLRALNSGAEIVKTVRDDTNPNNDNLDLLFEELDPTDFYTIEIDPGAEGEPYILRDARGLPIEHVSLSALKAMTGG
jgi:hypothetical protein